MKKIYHSIPVGVLLRTFSIILVFFMVFEAAHASPYANLNEFADYEFSIAENTPSGTVIGEVSVSNAEVFTIIDGNEEGFFKINELTGELSIGEGAGLDYETKASFTLTVEVSTDIGTSVVVITIHLLDVGGPEAFTGEAFDITEEGASLSGTFMDNGNHTVAAIQYGTTAQLDNDFNPEGAEGMEEAEAGAGETSLQLHLTGLDDATTYYYRTVAKNQEGVAFGETKSFTTCTIPVVEYIAIMDQNPTNSDLVHFLVTFSEPVEVATLSENDFELELITYESGSPLEGNIVEILPEDDEGKKYVVKVGLNDGDGSLKLIFRDDDSVESIACGVPVGGAGAENGDFEDGEIYTIDNTAPTTMTILYTNEDVPVTYDFALSDMPDDDDGLTVEFISEDNPELIPNSESGYEFSGTGNRRKIKIIPVAHKHGEGIVKVTLVDGAGNKGNTKELYIVVRAVADPPILVANDVSGDEDTGIPLDVSVSLADQDESEIIKSNSISISGLPSGASLSAGTDAGNGKYIFEDAALLADVEFIPPANLSGTYELTLSAISRELETEGDLVARREATATETFSVTVNAVNDEPVFALDPTEITLEEDFEEERYINILPGLVPADEQEQDVNYSVAPQGNEDPIAHVSIGADESGNPRVVITAKENGSGTQVFVVTANDGQNENNIHEEEFTLILTPVNDAPVFTLSEDRIEREEDFEGTVTVTLSDESPENESDQHIEYSLSPESVDFANISIDAETGTITITSVPDRFGSQVFVVTANDGQNESNIHEEEFTLVINPVNDAPAFALSEDRIEREEDFEGTVTVTLADESPENESDQRIEYSLSPESVDFANISIDAETGTITITSVPDRFGSQVFVVTANDGQNESNIHEEEFTLVINPVNDAPAFALSEDRIEREEDFEGTVTVTLADESLENESGQRIEYSLSPESVDFANISIDAETGTLSISSVQDRFGSQVFTVTANDGQEENHTYTREFTLVVNPVNDAPVFTLFPEEVIVNEDFTTEEKVVPELELPFPWGEEDETVSYSLRNADIDWANISLDPVSGIVTITAVENGNGEQIIELVATDNGTPSEASYVQTFLLRVIPVNDEPVLAAALEDLEIYEDERWEYSIPEDIFTDPDGNETLTFSASMESGEELPAWLSFDAASKTFSGTPDGPDVGSYQLLVKATEPDGASIQDDFTLTVIEVNDVPEISAIADVTVDLGDPVEPITFSISDEETVAAELIVTVATDNSTLLPESAMVLSGEGEDRKLFITPPFEEWGSAVVTVMVSDGEGEASSEFTFTVNLKTLALDIPDLITPNGDKANDTWNIRYLSLYDNNEVRVFDHTGKIVFGARNYSESREWDGTHNGRHLPEGVYFYEIKLNNGSINKRGTITIAR